jgi:hypothetical protein
MGRSLWSGRDVFAAEQYFAAIGAGEEIGGGMQRLKAHQDVTLYGMPEGIP